jgi:putative flippase GtrA
MHRVVDRFLRYLVAGGAAAMVDVGLFAALHAAPLPTPAAAGLSFLAAAAVNFQLSARFVFGHAPTGRTFARFFLVALVGLAVNVAVTVAGERLLGLPPVAGKLLGIACALAVNFTLNLVAVFRPESPT